MTAYTQSGYPVIDEYGDPELLSNPEIPGTGGVRVMGGLRRGDVATVLLYVCERWQTTVEPIIQSQGVWGYGKREIRGGSGWSNHAGGCAVDINAAIHGQGAATMSEATKNLVRAIIDAVNDMAGTTIVDWGGEWSGGTKDEMHVQMHGNASWLAVATAAQKIRGETTDPTGDDEMTLDEFKEWAKSPSGKAFLAAEVVDKRFATLVRDTLPDVIDSRFYTLVRDRLSPAIKRTYGKYIELD